MGVAGVAVGAVGKLLGGSGILKGVLGNITGKKGKGVEGTSQSQGAGISLFPNPMDILSSILNGAKSA